MLIISYFWYDLDENKKNMLAFTFLLCVFCKQKRNIIICDRVSLRQVINPEEVAYILKIIHSNGAHC